MVSIIIRTKDREQFLARALKSIGAQTWKDLEAIVVNSSEASLALKPSAYGFPVRILERAGETTLAKAINRGILAAEGDYVALLDDDDTWEPAYLERHMTFLAAHPECSGSASLTSLVLECLEGETYREIGRKPFNRGPSVSFGALLYHNRFTTNAFVYAREAALSIGLYDERLNELEDWDFNLRFASRYRIGRIPEYLSNYHKRPGAGTAGAQGNTSFERHRAADGSVRRKFLEDPGYGAAAKTMMRFYGWIVAGKMRIRRLLNGKKP